MTDLRDNLGWIIGSVIAGIVAFLSWFYESGLLSTLVGIIVGAGIAFFVQTRTQDRAWKREYAVKIAEEVYGNLFKEVKSIIRSLEEKIYIYYVSFSKWSEFQQDHRYFMVDNAFRLRLDNFSERLEKYSRAVLKLNDVLRKIVFEEIERVFEWKTDQIPQVQIRYMRGYTQSSTSSDLIRCLATETFPTEMQKKIDPDITNLELTVTITSIDSRVLKISYPQNKEFDEFWQSCIRRMKENDTYRFLVEENNNILEDAKRLREEIIERIEKPWKI